MMKCNMRVYDGRRRVKCIGLILWREREEGDRKFCHIVPDKQDQFT